MDYVSGQSSNQPGSGSPSDDDVLLASSCPKKRAGRKKVNETRHPVYRGIRLRNGNRWVCEVRTPTNNSRIWLGSYPTAEMAARAHDVAALALRGRGACLNFADSAWRLPVPVSLETMDIQRAAAEAAEMFRPPELEEPTQDGNAGVQYNEHALPAQENSQMSNIYNNYNQENFQMNNNYNNYTQESFQMNNNNYNNYNQENSLINNNYNQENLQQLNNNYNVAPTETSSSSHYMDEEAMFNMPSLINNMAEGMMLPPPRNPSGWDDDNNENDGGNDFSLWNF